MKIITFRKIGYFFSFLGTKFSDLIHSKLVQSLGILGVIVGIIVLYCQETIKNNFLFDKALKEFQIDIFKIVMDQYKNNYSSQNNTENRNKLAEELYFFSKLNIKNGLDEDFLKDYINNIKNNTELSQEKIRNQIFFYKNANTFIEKNSGFKNITNEIDNASNSIWFYGTSFQITFKEYQKDILNALCRGVNIRILVPNPEEKNYELAMLAAGQNSATEQYKTNDTYHYYYKIKKLSDEHYKSGKCSNLGKIELRRFNDIPHYRGYFFDAEIQDKSTVYFVTLHNGVTSRLLPGFWIKNTDGLMNLYVEGFNTMWKKASFLPEKSI